MTLPAHAQIVVIGGGIIGCSTAYHLARDHKADVVLLEQGKLTSGSTWHAAGLVGQLRSSASITQVLKYSVDLYKRLDAETGLETGWKMTGCLRLATNQDRWTEYRRLATTARSFGMEMHLISPDEVKTDVAADGCLRPGRRQSGCRPTDRPARPTSPSRWPRARACTARRSTRACGSPASRWTAAGSPRVKTNQGEIACDTVVNCAGQWARQVGRDGRHQRAAAAGQAPVHHHRTRSTAWPPTRRPCATPTGAPISRKRSAGWSWAATSRTRSPGPPDDVPDDWEFRPVRRRFRPFRAAHGTGHRPRPGAGDGRRQADDQRVGKLHAGRQLHPRRGAGMRQHVCRRRLQRLRHRLGRRRRLGAGRMGDVRARRRSICGSVDIRRFSDLHRDRHWVCDRTCEAYGKHYTIGFPHEEYTVGPPAHRLAAL